MRKLNFERLTCQEQTTYRLLNWGLNSMFVWLQSPWSQCLLCCTKWFTTGTAHCSESIDSFIHSTNIYWVSVSSQRWRRQTRLSALWILQPGTAPLKDTLSLCGFCLLFFSSPSGLRVGGGRWPKSWNSRLSLWFSHSHPYLCNKPFLKPSSYHPNLSVPSVFCWNIDCF